MKLLCLLAAAGVFAGAGVALAGGDPAKGEIVFGKCRACHSVERGLNRVGPSLYGIVDEPVASLRTYQYSQSMKSFGAAGRTWDEATLAEFLAAPKATLPGTAMAFYGLKNPADVADIIAYLRSTNARQ